MPGADDDGHGCKPSTGYMWCESLGECVRTWETPCPGTSESNDADKCVDAGGYPVYTNTPEVCARDLGKSLRSSRGDTGSPERHDVLSRRPRTPGANLRLDPHFCVEVKLAASTS